MGDGGVIPNDRTAVPVEWDQVKTQLTRLATDLGPQNGGVRHVRVAIHRQRRERHGGNGDKLRQTIAQLSGAARVFAEGSGNIVDIIKNLQTYVSALRDSTDQIVLFQNRLASLTSVVNDSRSDLDGALTNLSVALGEVRRFVAGSRDQTSEQIERLGNLTQSSSTTTCPSKISSTSRRPRWPTSSTTTTPTPGNHRRRVRDRGLRQPHAVRFALSATGTRVQTSPS